MNKNIIKETFDKHFNIDTVHDEIIKKVESKPKITYKKYVLVPITVMLLGFLSIYLLLYNHFIGYQKDNINPNNDIIKINVIADEKLLFEESKYLQADVDGRLVSKSQEELIKQFPFIQNLEIPLRLQENTIVGEIYASSNSKSEFYHKLSGYYLRYFNNENNSYIDIFFSKTNKERARCTPLIRTDLEDSLVNNIPIKIVKYYNNYLVLFQYQDLYFDIETRNIKEEELIGLIRSIVKEDN